MTERSEVIAEVCRAVLVGDLSAAVIALKRDYPFAPSPRTIRAYGPVESTRVFLRDGFLDRYTGDRLIFPPVLRVLAARLPAEFPFHPNWKADVTHPAFWEVGATVDHLIPASRGGPDDDSNWVTTSMARNSAKMNWTLDELGWSLHPPGDPTVWDGMLAWFLDITAADPGLLLSPSMRQWHRGARTAL